MKMAVRWEGNYLVNAEDTLAFIFKTTAGTFIAFRLKFHLGGSIPPKAKTVEVCEEKTLEEAKQAVEVEFGLH